MSWPEGVLPWIIRPFNGTVSERTFSRRDGRPKCLRALIPRSERARLMDLVKFSGVVEGSRRSRRRQNRSLGFMQK